MTRTPVILSVDPSDPPSKQAIAKAALARFVHKGVDGVTIRELAAETGYTNPALYKFWDGKDALVLDVFERCYRQLVRHLEGAWSDDTTPLRAFVARYVDAVDDDLDAVLYVQDQLRALWPRASAATRRISLLGLVRRLVPDGAPAPKLVVAAIVGTLGQFARQLHFGDLRAPASAWREPLEEILARVIGGVS
jgi:AcrR family transcriptional regulator